MRTDRHNAFSMVERARAVGAKTAEEIKVPVIGGSYLDEPVVSASGCSGAGQQN